MRAFTLLEALLAVALVALVAGFSLPLYQSFAARNDLTLAAETMVHGFHLAQTSSQAVVQDQNWGLKAESGRLTVFAGSNFASRLPEQDEVFEISPAITVSGLTEVVFSKFSGDPFQVGSLTLTNLQNETRILTINSRGLVAY